MRGGEACMLVSTSHSGSHAAQRTFLGEPEEVGKVNGVRVQSAWQGFRVDRTALRRVGNAHAIRPDSVGEDSGLSAAYLLDQSEAYLVFGALPTYKYEPCSVFAKA